MAGCAASHDEARSGGGATEGASAGQLDQTAIDVAMERVRPIVSACVVGGRRNETWNVRVTIGPDGHPTDVRVDNEQPDPQMAACLEGAISGAVFPPFSGPPMTVSYPYFVR